MREGWFYGFDAVLGPIAINLATVNAIRFFDTTDPEPGDANDYPFAEVRFDGGHQIKLVGATALKLKESIRGERGERPEGG